VVVEKTADGEAITVPQYALITGAAGNGVFVAEGGVARWRPLSLGGLVGHDLIVTHGLREGEEVITKGHRELADGEAVIAVRTEEAAPVAAVLPAPGAPPRETNGEGE